MTTDPHLVVRHVAAAVVAVAGLVLSLFIASMAAWGVGSQEWQWIAGNADVLALSAVVGFWGVGLAWTIAGRDPLSWWLLAGLIPPTYFVVVGSGVL